jgi:hypothetical protein
MPNHRGNGRKESGRWVEGSVDSMTDDNYRIRLEHAAPGQEYIMVSKKSINKELSLCDRVKVYMQNAVFGSVEKI